MMLLAVLSGFLLAVAVPALYRVAGRHIGWVLALLPALLTAYFASLIPAISGGESLLIRNQWMPGLGVSLDFMVDGLSLVFALLISGIGTFILIYAGSYLKGHKDLARFYVVMLSFMASMLGLVLSDNLITFFVFWELTSITSYMLIGFNHEDAEARKCALQGLFVTAGGGLVLMAGLILLIFITGSYSFSEILASDLAIHEHGYYTAAAVCILVGAFTKSAQVPFHFWLPNAMAAPTPVSAYLHSATMVKAGVYLLARMNSSMDGDALWSNSLMFFGAATMLTGAYLAFSSTGIKKVLAYSTVMALGTLTMLIGVGTEKAIIAFVCVLVAHSLYKGALFMLAGALDHETGTKDITKMGGLWRSMPRTALITCMAALSLAGLPPLFGFVAKELMFESVINSPAWSWGLLAAAVASSILVVAVAGLVFLKPFFGPARTTPKQPHDAPFAMLIGPAVLTLLALILGVAPFLPAPLVLDAAVSSVYGSGVQTALALWHGVNVPLILSGISLLAGSLLFVAWQRLHPTLHAVNTAGGRVGPEAGYFRFMLGITQIASWQTRVLQNGVLGVYLLILVLVTFGLSGYTLFTRQGFQLDFDFSNGYFYEFGIALLIVAATVFASVTRSRLGSVASVGVLGFGVALIFIHFSAPDLGITQLLVETLTVILLVLVLFKLPPFVNLSSPWERYRDLTVAVFAGAIMTLLMLAALDIQYFDSISSYYIENSYGLAFGKNIVNVILVDFRQLDTLGEIFVLGLAAMGVYSMVKLRAEDQHKA
ncbi:MULTISPECIES: putative monovalent cation/H+ antiporter subunit A [unclassified Marinobacter]|uniref:putative monovalent cation/H+ antiporter subunit A n=1 Tax=unclassified Marinobacter TaxID=83889 RepID=UPI001928B10D|nr:MULTISPECIES: putative monovalent cation/H+ antiporter subunit A [unclassified Marinobacter]MBL3825757.1 putative monovalent cation/H+ antiporter subunit A [Marinobacter sp. MC3]MBL3894306.1 putative monovalent cation/H+ antiporter subunit A [Marinobacter sp. MW3]